MRSTKNVVIDTNVFVSAVLFPKSVPRTLVDQLFRNPRIVVLGSTETFTELTKTLLLSKFSQYATLTTRIVFLEEIESLIDWVTISEKVNDCRDSRDNKFLEVAVSGQANYIITGDNDLLTLNLYRGIEIITPRDFLEPLSKAA
jgi:uncharacterized protein